MRDDATTAAERSRLDRSDVVLRFGLYWGPGAYIGRLFTSGRTKVTALGDEVNEAARIEACATGGPAFASKSLIERLETDDATALGLQPDSITYTTLTDVAGAERPRDRRCRFRRGADTPQPSSRPQSRPAFDLARASSRQRQQSRNERKALIPGPTLSSSCRSLVARSRWRTGNLPRWAGCCRVVAHPLASGPPTTVEARRLCAGGRRR
jgi:hypothetical protein